MKVTYTKHVDQEKDFRELHVYHDKNLNCDIRIKKQSYIANIITLGLIYEKSTYLDQIMLKQLYKVLVTYA